MYRPSLFKGKTAIVTGGATGIGLAITKQLYNLGANVVMASRKIDNLKQAESDILKKFKSNSNNQLTHFQLDQRNLQQVDDCTNFVIKNFGQVDFLVANGGGQFFTKLENVSPNGWNAVVNTNLNGTFNLCHSVFNSPGGMKDKKFGRIVTMSVSYIQGGMYGMGHSGAARSGVENFTKTMAQEWAQYGVLSNCIAPGVIYSPTAVANYGPAGAKYFKMIGDKAPMGRLGKTEECAESVMFLLGAGYINGVILPVDGGQGLLGLTSYLDMEM